MSIVINRWVGGCMVGGWCVGGGCSPWWLPATATAAAAATALSCAIVLPNLGATSHRTSIPWGVCSVLLCHCCFLSGQRLTTAAAAAAGRGPCGSYRCAIAVGGCMVGGWCVGGAWVVCGQVANYRSLRLSMGAWTWLQATAAASAVVLALATCRPWWWCQCARLRRMTH